MKKIRLGEICKILSGGDKPQKVSNVKTKECNIPIYGNALDNKGLYGYTNFSVINEPSITIASRGSNCGNAFYRNEAYVPIIRLISLIPNKNIDSKYLYYLVKKQNFRSTGSGQPQITIPQISDCMVNIFEDITTQKAISDILGKIDEKIENNNQINKNLEEMMKTLYQRWFLEFEFPNKEGKPYKSSGGKMVWNDELKKEIPENWTVESIEEFVEKDTRKCNSAEILKTIDLSVMPSSSISLNDLNTSDKFISNLNIMEEGNILFGSIRPYLKKAGIAPCDGAVAGTVYSYKVLKEYNYNFVLITLTNERMFEFALSRAKGTRMPVISSDDLLKYKVAYNSEVVEKFNSIKIKDIICKNINENQELKELQDFLLPLLMNGQVKIGE